MPNLNSKTIVVILGGGRGNRLFPLTKMRSKPAVSFAGKYRLIDVPISNALHSGLSRIFVLTQFNSASLNQHIARTYNFDSFTHGFVDVLAAEQTEGSSEWFQGTADAVRKIYPHISNQRWEQALILSGDHLYRMDYAALLKHHQAKQADVSVCAVPVKKEEASDFGLIKVNAEGKITSFKEKPKEALLPTLKCDASDVIFDQTELSDKPYLASMGIYVFNRDILKKAMFEKPYLNDFGQHIIPHRIQKSSVFAYPFHGYWRDIGTIRSFFDANLSLCQMPPPFQLSHPTRPIYTRQRHLAGSTIIESNVRNCVINDGCLIQRSTIQDSVIGLRSVVHEGAHVERSLIMGADYYDADEIPKVKKVGIGKGCRIVNAIIDKNAHIGEGVSILNESKRKEYDDPEGRFYIRDGIVVVGKGVSIPDNMSI